MMVAFDHRSSLRERLARSAGVAPAAFDLPRHKAPIWTATTRLAADLDVDEILAVLVDRQTAASVVGRQDRVQIAVAIEESGRDSLALEADPSVLVRELIELEPTWTKVLLRWHPGSALSSRDAQGRVLEKARAVAEAAGSQLLIEVLIPPSDDDLRLVGGDQRGFEELVRPCRLADALVQIARYAEPALWKVEEVFDPDWCAALSRLAAESGGGADLVTLGGGRSIEDLEPGFAATRSAERFKGFAVGRTVWLQEVEAYAAGTLSDEQATEAIAANLGDLIAAYRKASTPGRRG